MDLTLYHYVHCPYCVRVRMGLGYLGLGYESRVVAYDDQETPERLTGVKMLPILSINGKPRNESLEIIRELDTGDRLKNHTDIGAAEAFIKSVNNPVHSLAMPYWIHTPEFSDSAREYFLKQKEAKRGPFPLLVQKADAFKAEIAPLLQDLSKKLSPYFESSELRIQDIMISAHLWGLYVVPEFQFPEVIHDYLQRVKAVCRFNYHQDFWGPR